MAKADAHMTITADTAQAVDEMQKLGEATRKASSPNSEWKALLIGLAANVVAMLVVAFGKKLGLDLDAEQIVGIVGLALGGNYGVAQYTKLRPAKGMSDAAKMQAANGGTTPPSP